MPCQGRPPKPRQLSRSGRQPYRDRKGGGPGGRGRESVGTANRLASAMHAVSETPELPTAGPAAQPPAPAARPAAEQPRRRSTDPEQLLAALNDPQRAAVVHRGSPLLIVAGAGSGKTRVLTHRIAYLLAAGGVKPDQIIAITFTNKAAGEMKDRVAALVGGRARLMWVSTFHSACVRILRAEHEHAGLKSTFSIYDADDSRRLMQMVVRELDLDPRRYPARSLTAQVSNLKNELITPESFTAKASGPQARIVAEAYTLYQRRLKEAHALDFDDLIMSTVQLLRRHPEVAQAYRTKFRHVLVDEYQDTNHAQYVLVKELVGPDGTDPTPGELCVVGDADQSIYAFRGATIRNILEFERDFPNAETILLEQNYRSTQTILTAANAVIDRNTERKPKRLWSDQGAGEPIVGYVADTERAEADWVAREIDRLRDDHEYRPADIAVFYRTNAQSRVFEEMFIRLGLPYKVVGGVRFYERKEVRDALAYLRAIINSDDTVSVRRVLNTPRRGIGGRGEAFVEALASREGISFGAALAKTAEVAKTAARTAAKTAEPAKAGDAPGISTRAASGVAEFVALLDDMRELAATAAPEEVLEAVLQRSGYLSELEDSLDPHLRSLGNNRELEEERRLAYVGITRARQRLYISHAITRAAWGQPQYNPASRFLGELPEELVRWERGAGAHTTWSGRGGVGGRSSFVGGTPKAAELAEKLGIDGSRLATASELKRADMPALEPGDRINHQRYGLGRILAVEGYGARAQAQVDFGEQVMWLVLRHAPIERL